TQPRRAVPGSRASAGRDPRTPTVSSLTLRALGAQRQPKVNHGDDDRYRKSNHADRGGLSEVAIDERATIQLDDQRIGRTDRAALRHQPYQVESTQRPDRDEQCEQHDRRLNRRPYDGTEDTEAVSPVDDRGVAQ